MAPPTEPTEPSRAGRTYRIRARAPAPVGPTAERLRQATAREGGVTRLPANDAGVACHGVRYPLLIDYLRDHGWISAADHATALAVRSLYERTSFRAHVTSAYRERTGRTANDAAREDADDRYRRLDGRVLRRAGRDAWTAFRAIVIEDRMTASLAALPRALAEAERWL